MQEKQNPGKLSRRQFLWTTATVSVGALLSACAPAPAGAPGASQESGAAAPAEEGVTLILNMRAGGDQSEPAIYVQRPATFMEENPNIKIELAPIPGEEYDAKIISAASAGTIGDVIWDSDVWALHTRLSKLGVIAPVDEQLEAAGISKDDWLPATVDTLTIEGVMYGLPKSSHPGDCYIWLNNSLFEAAGIPLPETYGVTFDEITAWAEALTSGPEDARDVYGFAPTNAGIQSIVNGVRQFGTYENNEEGTESLADNEQWYAWVEWNKNFYDKRQAPIEATLPTGGSNALFLAGKLAMRHSQRAFYRFVNEGLKEVETPFEYTIIQFPRGPEAKGWGASVDTHSATTATEHPDEAFLFSLAMADQTFTRYVAEAQGYLAARVDDLETIEDISTPFLELQYHCMTEEERFHQPANARGKEVETIYINELSQLFLGEEELNAGFMANVKAAVDETLDKPF